MKNNAMKRIIAALLIVALTVGGLGFSASAASTKGVSGFTGEDTLVEMWELGYSSGMHYEDLIVRPGDELVIPLTANMFDWRDERNLLPLQAVRIGELKRDVRVRTLVQAGWEVLDYVQLDTDMVEGKPFYQPGNVTKTGRTACINVAFAEKFVSVEPVDFRITIYLTADGEMDADYRMTIYGQMVPDEFAISPENDYVELSGGYVAVADPEFSVFSGLTTFDLGSGVQVSKLLWANRKYYGTAGWAHSTSLTPEDYPTIYNAIHGVYQLETVNIKEGVNRVKLTPPLDPDYPEYTTFHVYGEDMEYLGTTADSDLPYADTYILTFRQLDAFETGIYTESLENAPTQESATDSKPIDIAINDGIDEPDIKAPTVAIGEGEQIDS
ncbi:MAG: hypothetical protein ACK5LX_04780 [Oscillospiraceae bacterium]